MSHYATRTRPKLTQQDIYDGLTQLGLTEEETPIDGYGFTFHATPAYAVLSYQQQHGGKVPTRFWIDRRTFILAD
jgi:hypothetical protein